MILKEDIKKLVELFYRHNFKLFYINSNDGVTFEKSEKVFISLGITTNLKTLNYVSESIKISSNYKYRSHIAEVGSKKLANTELYMNYVNKVWNNIEDVKQYDQFPTGESLAISEVSEYLEKLNTKLSEKEEGRFVDSNDLRKEIADLTGLYEKYKDQTNICFVKENGLWETFYNKVNYKKENSGTEFRIGILIE